MPEPPVDLTEFARLKNIHELLRQAGIKYPGLSQAGPPQAFQDLMRSAPVAAPAVSTVPGLGFLGMLATLLSLGGDTRQGALQQALGTAQAPIEPMRRPERLYPDLEEFYASPMLNKMTSQMRTLPIQEDLRPPSLARRQQ